MILYIRGSPNWVFGPPFNATWQNRPCFTALELGSGTGIVGSCIAETLARPGRDLVIVTDLPGVCPLLEENLSHQLIINKRNSIHSGDGVVLVRPLAWGNPEHTSNLASELSSPYPQSHPRHLTHIVCSDLVS